MRRTSDFFQFVVGSAVFMGLGWQLPAAGVFLALWLCILLRIELHRAAPIVAIAAIGFSQSRLLMHVAGDDLVNPWSSLIWMGAGGVRGLTFGAFLGLGLAFQRLGLSKFYALVFGFLLPCAGTLYAMSALRPATLHDFSFEGKTLFQVAVFQDLWAGLLVGTLCLLLGLWAFGLHRIPMRFALYGVAGGAVGCALWLLLQGIAGQTGLPKFEEAVDVLGPWILGASLGGACGWCALRYRDELSESMESIAREPWRDVDFIVLGLSTAVAGLAFYLLGDLSTSPADSMEALQTEGFFDSGRAFALLGCAGACCLLLWAARSSAVAWQLAITLPVLISLNDLVAFFSLGLHGERFGLLVGLPLVLLILVGARVFLWHARGNQPLAPMGLALLWICSGCTLLRIPLELVYFESPTGAAVFRAVLLGAATIYGTVALWPWRKVSGAPPAPRPA